MAEILVVDDEIGIRELLSEILGDEGHTVHLAESAAQARAYCQGSHPDLVLLDIWMPDTDGVTLLKEWSSRGELTMPVIMMSGHATIDTAVEATRIGAMDFLEKPITLQKLLRAVEAGLIKRKPLMSLSGSGKEVSMAAISAAATQGKGSTTTTFLPVKASLSAGSGSLGSGLEGSVGSSAGSLTPVSGSMGSGSMNTGLSAATAGGHYPSFASLTGEHPNTGGLGLSTAGDFQNNRNLSSAQVAVSQIDLDSPLREARDAFERAYFEHHLQREQGSMTRVAEKTGLERTHLYRKLKQLGIDLTRGAYRKNGH
jgi:DNA-binding NtrC family response regulator